MNVRELELPGVMLIEPKLFGDARGYLFESWNEARFAEVGIAGRFVQDNVSRSERGVLRGLHVQHPGSQGKLVTVMAGEVFDVAVDIRRGSPAYGKWVGVRLSEENHRQLYLPPGFAHGFQVLSEYAVFAYKCTDYYRSETEATIAWDDPELGIEWPLDHPTLSERDKRGSLLAELPLHRTPLFP